jgi:hypothetical protein
MIHYHHNVIAIEALKPACVQIQTGRFDPGKHHRSTAIWARMNLNLVGREAKERFRSGHLALPRSSELQGSPYRSRLAVAGPGTWACAGLLME